MSTASTAQQAREFFTGLQQRIVERIEEVDGTRFRRDQCVHDRLFGGSRRRLKERADPVVRQHFEVNNAFILAHLRIGCAESNKNITGRISSASADNANSKSNTPYNSFQLVREQRRVSCNHNND